MIENWRFESLKHALLIPCSLVFFSLLSDKSAGHHSLSPYDRTRQIELRGVVRELLWKNPHVYLHVEVLDDAGRTVLWEIEGPHPGWMGRAGWDADTVQSGDSLAVIGNPGRNPDTPIMLGSLATLPDGTELTIPQARGARPAADIEPEVLQPSEGIAGRWLPTQTPPLTRLLVIQDAEALPLTARGVASINEYTPEQNPALNCEVETAPLLMYFPFVQHIELFDDRVVIRTESYETERVVFLNQDSHGGAGRSRQGHSIGSWEGDSLVVDTRAFTENRRGNGFVLASSEEKHLIERFEPSSDRTKLVYRFHLEDPEYLSGPIQGQIVLTHRPDLPVVPDVECDPEAARRFLEL